MFSIIWGTRKHRVLISFHNIEVNIMIRRSSLESRGFVRALADSAILFWMCLIVYKEYNY